MDRKTAFIIGGCTAIVLATVTEAANISLDDPVFWYVFCPIAFVVGLFIQRSSCP